jgi:hypothetical protein
MELFSVIISAVGIFFCGAVVVIGGSYIAYKTRNRE